MGTRESQKHLGLSACLVIEALLPRGHALAEGAENARKPETALSDGIFPD